MDNMDICTIWMKASVTAHTHRHTHTQTHTHTHTTNTPHTPSHTHTHTQTHTHTHRHTHTHTPSANSLINKKVRVNAREFGMLSAPRAARRRGRGLCYLRSEERRVSAE